MSERREPVRADRRFLLRLALLSALVIAGIGFWTRGASRVLAVEERLPAMHELAEREGVPLPALLAAVIFEHHAENPREDARVAAEIASYLRATGGDVPSSLARFAGDPAAERRLLDLWRRKRERWRRMAERLAPAGRDD